MSLNINTAVELLSNRKVVGFVLDGGSIDLVEWVQMATSLLLSANTLSSVYSTFCVSIFFFPPNLEILKLNRSELRRTILASRVGLQF
jgi:hypothetical protein